jgi:drug/metabolite transporter (DMT)-like permease
MFASAQLAPTLFALLATFSWGVSDFVGGFASKRTNAFLVTSFTHMSGATLMLGLALALGSPFPSQHAVVWAMAAGLVGGLSLAIFYRALAVGKMGLTAPVAALLGAGIPTLVGIYRQGTPGVVRIAGFVLAGIGIWLVSRSEGQEGHTNGLGLAVLAGIGFAGFFLCMKQAGDISPLWGAGLSRSMSLVATSIVVLVARQRSPLARAGIGFGLLAGVVDSTGTAVYVRASQLGRLDSAVVISSLYPAITVLLARVLLGEHFTRWKMVGLVAALAAVPMIAM